MKKKVIVLGSGFASFSFIKAVHTDFYDITVVSERNHFLFTPLLPSTTVGTIEFRSIIEPIRESRKGLAFIQARCERVEHSSRKVFCKNVIDGKDFNLIYDFLVIAVGAVNHTFGIKGVHENAFFLKELRDARKIRQRIIDNFEQASTPGLEAGELSRILHFVVVGGGPTGVEFAAEMTDFLEEELTGAYPELVGSARITLIEGSRHILSQFDKKIAEYATKLFNRRRVAVLTNKRVQEVLKDKIVLEDGSEMPYGMLVWSTGNGPTDLVNSLNVEKDASHRILTNEHFCVSNEIDLFALGDCATIKSQPLVATAQVAIQSGKYLARLMNAMYKTGKPSAQLKPFVYKHMGMLAYIGKNRAVADLPNTKARGFTTWLFWRSAYLTRLISLKNKILVIFDWTKAILFGRDISRF
jgi:NADH:ubiquinone reductase (non-electrogenic)